MSAHVPYCGLPASPDRIWSAWNLDPLLLLLLAGMALLYSRLSDPVTAKERTCFHLGLCIAGAALVSPLCNLGVSLFSAREAQHMILALLAAPLLVTGHLGTVARPLSGRLAGRLRTGMLPAAAFALLLWAWHIPAVYEATLRSTPIYWLMHGSLFLAALALWRRILSAERGSFSAMVASLLSLGQMTALGALLTLSNRSFYRVHTHTAQMWGLTGLQDQQLAGVIMWVPACTVFVVSALWAFSNSIGLLQNGARANARGPRLARAHAR